MHLPLSWLLSYVTPAWTVDSDRSRDARLSSRLRVLKGIVALLSFEIEYSFLSRFSTSMCAYCLEHECPRARSCRALVAS